MTKDGAKLQAFTLSANSRVTTTLGCGEAEEEISALSALEMRILTTLALWVCDYRSRRRGDTHLSDAR